MLACKWLSTFSLILVLLSMNSTCWSIKILLTWTDGWNTIVLLPLTHIKLFSWNRIKCDICQYMYLHFDHFPNVLLFTTITSVLILTRKTGLVIPMIIPIFVNLFLFSSSRQPIFFSNHIERTNYRVNIPIHCYHVAENRPKQYFYNK